MTHRVIKCFLLALAVGWLLNITVSAQNIDSPSRFKRGQIQSLAGKLRHDYFAKNFFKAGHSTKPLDLFSLFTEHLFAYPQSTNHRKANFFTKPLDHSIPISTSNFSHKLSGEVQVEWVTQYASQLLPSDDVATAVAVDRRGNVYVTGTRTNHPFGTDYFTVKYDGAGHKKWEARYNGESDNDDWAVALCVDEAGNVYVTGGSENAAASSDYFTVKYNAGGAVQWRARYDGPRQNSYDAASVITLDRDGNVLVSGWSENHLVTVKYDAAGVEQWVAQHRADGNGEVSAIAADRFGNVYIAGACHDDFITIKYNASGQQEWVADYHEANNSYGLATALAVDDSGKVLVTGTRDAGSYPKFVTVKYDQTGAREWQASYDSPQPCNWNIATALALDDSGNVYVAGESGFYYEDCSGSSCFTHEDIDYATIKYNRQGAMQWAARYGPQLAYSYPAAMQVDRAGNVYVTGCDNKDIATIKYDAAGTQQWLAYYSRSENEEAATALTLDDAGNVLVCGWNIGERFDQDYLTIKYNGAGFEQWTAHESSRGNSFDRATALVIDAVGNAHVTGVSQTEFNSSTQVSRLATIKYNSQGATQWTAYHQGAESSQETVRQIAVDGEGNVYVIGSRLDENRGFYNYGSLIKYNPRGELQWRAAFDSAAAEGFSLPNALALDAWGNIYVTGASATADFSTAKFAASGKELWRAQYGQDGNALAGASALALDDSSHVYVTGKSDGACVTIKYSSNGLQKWVARYDSPESLERVVAIAAAPSGGVVVLASLGFYADYVTIKYNREGLQEWIARYSSTKNSFDHPTALAIDHAGNVHVTGNTATIKYDAVGTQKWLVTPGATALALDAAGNVYTTGGASDSTDANFVTTKLSPLGQREWSAEFDGAGNSFDEPAAIALDKFNNVFVTGKSRGGQTQHWSYFTTIKYAQNAVAVENQKTETPLTFSLAQNYPNPFWSGAASGKAATTVHYSVAQTQQVSLKIFDLLGREVATLVNAIKAAGEYDVRWTPAHLPSGVYVYRLQVADPAGGGAGNFVASKKLVLMP